MHRFHTSILTHIVTVWWLNKNIQANFNNPKIEEILDHPSSMHLTAFFFFTGLMMGYSDTITRVMTWWRKTGSWRHRQKKSLKKDFSVNCRKGKQLGESSQWLNKFSSLHLNVCQRQFSCHIISNPSETEHRAWNGQVCHNGDVYMLCTACSRELWTGEFWSLIQHKTQAVLLLVQRNMEPPCNSQGQSSSSKCWSF